MVEPNEFVRASKYDVASQRHNRAVFALWLRVHPVAAVALSGMFVALGIGILLVPNPREHPVWIVAVLAFAAAAYLLTVTFRHRS